MSRTGPAAGSDVGPHGAATRASPIGSSQASRARSLDRIASDIAKRWIRRYAVATSRFRPLPDFIILGTKRGGTTTLYRSLLGHPWVVPLVPAAQRIKGVHFFDRNFARGTDWYRSHFPSTAYAASVRAIRGHPILSGEASPYYLLHPLAPERAASVAPDARLIVLLRDPVDRAFSHYRDEVKLGHETLSFDAALDAEEARIRPELAKIASDPNYHSAIHEHFSYVSYGHYADQLRRWFTFFSREQLLVVLSEELFADPAEALRKVMRFLGLPPSRYPVPRRLNAAPTATLDPAVRARLETYYRPGVADLEDLLERRLLWRRPEGGSS
jgi:hypothetical protein